MWDVPPVNNHTLQDIQSEIKERQILYETSVVAHDTKTSNISQPESRKLASPFSINESNCSTLIKILRITAHANRFVNRLKKNITPQGTLTLDELEIARRDWIRYLQRKYYIEMSQGKLKLNKQTAANQLNPKIEEDGIVTCHGRYTNADLPEEAITPILLPRGERLWNSSLKNTIRSCFTQASTIH